jgi:hypothetical protein
VPLPQRKQDGADAVVLESSALRKRHVRHEPEKTVVYEVVLGWLETFLCCAREADERDRNHEVLHAQDVFADHGEPPLRRGRHTPDGSMITHRVG